MLFNSAAFSFYFLPALVVVFFACTHRGLHRTSLLLLASASLLFYSVWNPVAVFLLIGSVLFNFSAGSVMAKGEIPERPRRLILVSAISIDVALLGYFKYANFLAFNFSELTGFYFWVPPILLPLAISFFTFTQIAFLVDAYRGEVHDVDFLRYLVFVTFFPHLIAGPIYHHKEMMPQFSRMASMRLVPRNVAAGLALFGIGLFKKIVFADTIRIFADPVFSAASAGWPLGFFEAWGGLLAFLFQLYFDFSGYSDMALGLALMLNVRMPMNFNSPYKATSIADLWRRWHMTLTRFLTDYIYTPLALKMGRAGVRPGMSRKMLFVLTAAIPMNVTFLAAGFWHGAGWNFVLFGVINGVALTINHAWRAAKGPRLPAPGAWALTLLTFTVSLVFFRASSVGSAWNFVAGLVGMHGFGLPLDPAADLGRIGAMLAGLGMKTDAGAAAYMKLPGEFLWIFGLGAFVLLFPNSQQLLRPFRPVLEYDTAEDEDAPVRVLGIDLGALLTRTPRLAARFAGPLAGAALASAISGLIFWQSWNRIEIVQFIYFQF